MLFNLWIFPNILSMVHGIRDGSHRIVVPYRCKLIFSFGQPVCFAVQQVNSALTIRNWMIGFYIVKYEQNGSDRAAFGERMMKELAKRLKYVKGIS
jgi:hypothetical protein